MALNDDSCKRLQIVLPESPLNMPVYYVVTREPIHWSNTSLFTRRTPPAFSLNKT